MLEVLLGLLLTVALATLVFRATGASAYSLGRLQDELQLQEAKRHILTQLEKIICYDETQKQEIETQLGDCGIEVSL